MDVLGLCATHVVLLPSFPLSHLFSSLLIDIFLIASEDFLPTSGLFTPLHIWANAAGRARALLPPPPVSSHQVAYVYTHIPLLTVSKRRRKDKRDSQRLT